VGREGGEASISKNSADQSEKDLRQKRISVFGKLSMREMGRNNQGGIGHKHYGSLSVNMIEGRYEQN